ncbi:site-2 protease family protein [Anaeromicrobium sediminis]|uniref:Peptidase M50 n=1 Tax=Anaeromicrobium sediminis TaxID=1478221 RepID=A0A267MCK3_9FIRM|nr:site-2 protease family protein [Anaeromicrobium sediminis]PAB57112.1 peptidase M50 [Anaeromicrobium sediminis]
MSFNIMDKLLLLPGILIGLSFHEYAHAQMAVWLGDDTPKKMGRLTISPLPHIDFVGFIFLLIAGFGWAKPVVIDPRNFKNPKRDDVLVSLAGPFMNILLAIFFFISIKIIFATNGSIMEGSLLDTTIRIFQYAAWINVVLCVFNLFPFPPLDGSHVIVNLFNLYESPNYFKIYNFSRFVLLILIITDIIDKLISPPIIFVYNLLASLIF